MSQNSQSAFEINATWSCDASLHRTMQHACSICTQTWHCGSPATTLAQVHDAENLIRCPVEGYAVVCSEHGSGEGLEKVASHRPSDVSTWLQTLLRMVQMADQAGTTSQF